MKTSHFAYKGLTFMMNGSFQRKIISLVMLKGIPQHTELLIGANCIDSAILLEASELLMDASSMFPLTDNGSKSGDDGPSETERGSMSPEPDPGKSEVSFSFSSSIPAKTEKEAGATNAVVVTVFKKFLLDLPL